MQGRWLRNQNVLLQKPDGPLVSHRTLSLSPALRVLTCGNTCLVYLGGILRQPRELREQNVLRKWRGAGFTKGSVSTWACTGDRGTMRNPDRSPSRRPPFLF